MGSSASTPNNFFTKSQHQNSLAEDNINTSSCSCYALESSKFSSASSTSSKAKTVVSRALSLPLPTPLLVHHPPSRKGDTHHLVSLTSTHSDTVLSSLLTPQPRIIKRCQQQQRTKLIILIL